MELNDNLLYSIKDVAKLTTWSEETVRKMFNAKGFPSKDYGQRKLVLGSALRKFFEKLDD